MKHQNSYLFLFFLAAITFASCKKAPQVDSITPSSARFYFQANIDGAALAIELLPDNSVQLSTSNDGILNPPACTFSYGAFIGPESAELEPIAGLDFVQAFSGDCADEGLFFNSLFPVGIYPFVDVNSIARSVVIRYIDDSGFYSSANGAQTDAQFAITGSIPENDEFGQSQTVTGTFQCAVYNAAGDKKELTNGFFKMNFRPYL